MNSATKTTQASNELGDLVFQISGMDDAAQNAEDNDNMKRAWAIRAKIKPLQARLATLVAAARAEVQS